MSTLSTTVRRGLVVTAAAMAAGPVVGGVASAATAPTTSVPLGGLDSVMPISGGLANGLPVNGLTGALPLNNIAGGLPVSGLAGQLPVVGPMAQNLPVVGQLTGAPAPTSPSAAAAGEQAASDLKAAFPAPHMPTPPALMTPAHAGKRSRTVSPVAPSVSAPTITASPAAQAPAAAARPQSSLPLVGQLPTSSLPVVGSLTQGLPVGSLTGLLGGF